MEFDRLFYIWQNTPKMDGKIYEIVHRSECKPLLRLSWVGLCSVIGRRRGRNCWGGSCTDDAVAVVDAFAGANLRGGNSPRANKSLIESAFGSHGGSSGRVH